jgi:hypothetical protein
MGGNFIAITIAATSGVKGRESGLASGILNTSQQIGGAIGLAVLTGLSTSAAARYLQHLHGAHTKLTPLAAEVHGFHVAYLTASFFMLSAAVLATFLLKQQKVSSQDVDAAMQAAG